MASNREGPTIMWGILKGKEIKTNDGNDVGEIKEISQNYLRVEKGTINKEKFWIPKYLADAFDGKTLWLLINKDDLFSRYLYGSEPPSDQYSKEFDTFRQSPYGKKATFLDDSNQNVRLKENSETQTSSTGDTSDEYKNIRDTT
jgi:hypothetical protein